MKALAIATVASIGAIAGAVLWLALFGDPMGGEPVSVVDIDPATRPASALESIAPKPTTKAGKTQSSLRTEERDPAMPEMRERADKSPSGEFKPPPDVAVVGLNTTVAKNAGVEPSRPFERAVAGDGGTVKMPPVPIDALIETSGYGPLPRIAADGRRPSHAYARPIRISALPQRGEPARIAVLVNGLGLSQEDTTQAIDTLPGAVTLAFGPYGTNLQGWVRKAHGAGHEVMLQVPLEPFDYPDNDPGPHTLLTSLKADENLKRLRWIMARFTGYMGITNHMGTKFQAAQDAMSPFLTELKSRGLIYVDDGSAGRSAAATAAQKLDLGFARAEVAIDADQTREGIDKALAKLESVAKENGLAVAVGTSLPVTIERISEWSKTLKDKGLVLIPISAAVHAQRQS